MAAAGVLCTWCVCVLCVLAVWVGGGVGAGADADADAADATVCRMAGCNCTQAAHKKLQVVNCTFDDQQAIDLRPGMIPIQTVELSITGGVEVRFHPELFTNLALFHRLRLDSTRNITFKKHTFLNLTINVLLMQIVGCDRLHFETQAFKNNKGPLTAAVSRCGYVSVQKHAFSFLQEMKFEDVPRIDMMDNAFFIETQKVTSTHGSGTTINFHNVKIPTIPKNAFKLSMAELIFHNVEVDTVMGEAFSGNTIYVIAIHNSTLRNIRSRAFSSYSQLGSLHLGRCNIGKVEPGALLSAIANLTVEHSNISEIDKEAFNMSTVVRVQVLNNDIMKIQKGGFTFRDWNCVYIENNYFEDLQEDSVTLSGEFPTVGQSNFSFSENEILMVQSNALRFVPLVEASAHVTSRLDTNYFKNPCNCDINEWLVEILGANSAAFLETNYCTIRDALSKCFDKDLELMRNFTDHICNDGGMLQCKSFTADQLGTNGSSSGQGTDNMILGLVLGLVLLVAVCGTVVILLVHGGLWLKRKGYCVRFNNFQYHPEEGSTEAEDIMVGVDKDKETFPEELTQELLQALREKLENPMTHDEAREMIERLYDHFILENSYTNNNRQEEETHLYEELSSMPQASADAADKNPTRPFSFLRMIEDRFNLTPCSDSGAGAGAGAKDSVLVGEYSEPTDAEVHLYSEVSQNLKEGKQNEINEGLVHRDGSGTLRSTGSHRMAYRPLPDKPPPPNDPGEGPSTKI